MKNMVKLGFIMAIYATVACVSLAFVYTGTQKVIAERQKADLETALKDLFPLGDSFEEITGTLQSPNTSVAFKNEYLIKQADSPIGVAVRAVGASYGGPVTVLVGVGTDGKIAGVKVLENKDTPGLGANAANPSYFVDRASGITFYGQFKGKSISDPFEVKGDVIAITASTITSKAVTTIVKAAGQTAGTWLATQTGGSK
ncbi:FMN-binding protein [Gracilinema caldarium]|uniref:Ion-translocating oxidoreductase complex subunit G n=1 Tax=Gracilinema caldarium (strain ATCC 51460 / DSM 7334 / H1) TaxID=744872 RepID=F8EX60_GRAC1|nr:FMN-binding protein [Gracilinema caldarium]AEJ18803.1 FMN-binding domain protein [Gracilinema caldarium DSM 7334]